uniref:Putative secreted protein n=1 Tax=Ixodes ricinus TaxID=34613 RepID=A0A6B0U688_IXORI
MWRPLTWRTSPVARGALPAWSACPASTRWGLRSHWGPAATPLRLSRGKLTVWRRTTSRETGSPPSLPLLESPSCTTRTCPRT